MIQLEGTQGEKTTGAGIPTSVEYFVFVVIVVLVLVLIGFVLLPLLPSLGRSLRRSGNDQPGGAGHNGAPGAAGAADQAGAVTAPEAADQAGTPTKPWGYHVLVTAILTVAVVFLATMLMAFTENVKVLFTEPAQVIAALSLAFTVIATLVGTYFGIKTGGDARDTLEKAHTQATNLTQSALDQAQQAVQQAHDTAQQAVQLAQGRESGVDLISVVNDFHTAWNAGNQEERLVGFFADGAVVRLIPPPPRDNRGGTYTGKEQIREFVRKYMPNSRADSRNQRAEGNKVTWDFTVTGQRYRDWNVDPVSGRAEAVFAGRTINSLTFTLPSNNIGGVARAPEGGQEGSGDQGG